SSIISPCITSARPWMRTMPSATEVTVPSLRASADSLTLSMRERISSLISEGLSVVVAIASFPVGRTWARRGGGSGPALWCCLGSVGQRGLQAPELALERAVDDDVAGGDHRAADEAFIDGGLDLDLAAEAALERLPQLLDLGLGQLGGGGDRGQHHLLVLGPQLLEQAGDLRQHRQAVVVGQLDQETGELVARALGR